MESKKQYIAILALLGDPEVPVGVSGTGGFNKTVNELLKILKNFNMNFIVITNKNKYNTAFHSKLFSNIDIYRVDFDYYWESNQEELVKNIDIIIKRVYNTLFSLVSIEQICLIHSFYWISGYIASKISALNHTQFIHTVVSLSEDKYTAGVKPHSLKQRELECQFLPQADIIFAITPQEKKTLVNKYNISESAIKVIGRSINECFENSYIDSKETSRFDAAISEFDLIQDNSWWSCGVFLYVGRIVEIKGVKQIVTAWISAKEKYNIDTPIWFVGGTPQNIDKMRKLILNEYPQLVEYEKTKQVIWWGNLDSKGISTLMRKAQALIMHSSFEAGGRVIIEAFSAGIPVIATPYGFAKDYIHNGYNGYTVDFNDIEGLAKIIKLFSKQPYLSSVMGTAAHRFMRKIIKKWNYENNHFETYNSYINKKKIPHFVDELIIPDDIDSFKSRNCVTIFPYFSTDISIHKLSTIINTELGDHSIILLNDDSFHSDIYRINCNQKKYYLKHFYHIITNRLTQLQYKEKYVISAQTQTTKSINSSTYANIADIIIGDNSRLLYVIQYYIPSEFTSFDILISLWNEAIPDKYYIKLYSEKKFAKLKEIIKSSEDMLINNLFCAEIAYEELFIDYNLPNVIDNKIRELINTNSANAFGINYGKGILNHVILESTHAKLLPTHSMFYGELGYDIVLTFLQYHKDDIKLWIEMKNSQKIVSSPRLDLWFLIIVFALEKEDEFHMVIRYILDTVPNSV